MKNADFYFRIRDNEIKNSEKQKSSNRFRNVFIEMWIIMLSGPATNLPSLTKERLFIATCLFSSIIFGGSFQVNRI